MSKLLYNECGRVARGGVAVGRQRRDQAVLDLHEHLKT